MRKGIAELQIIYMIIALVVIILVVVSIAPKEQALDTYLEMPPGISLSLSSAKDFPTFINDPKPGNMVFLGDKSITINLAGTIISKFEDIPAIITNAKKDPLKNTQNLGIMPTAAIYPLFTGKCDKAQISQPPGGITLTMGIDTSTLNSYLMKTYNEGFASENPETDASFRKNVGENVRIKICWNHGTKCLDDNERGYTLEELINSGKCAPEMEQGFDSLRKFKCTFSFSPIENCCPGQIDIEPSIELNLWKGGLEGGVTAREIFNKTTLAPQMIYYIDDRTNRDSIFKDLGTMQKNCFTETKDDKEIKPVANVSIYPCRAIIPSAGKLDELSKKVKGPNLEDINFGDCDKASIVPDTQEYRDLGSGWLCKKSNGGSYYLFNPYAACNLVDYSLPSSPTPLYLEGGVIPEGERRRGPFEVLPAEWVISWSITKDYVDAAYFPSAITAGSDTAPPTDNGNGNTNPPPQTGTGATTQPSDTKPAEAGQNINGQKPAAPVSESWIIESCSAACKNLCVIYQAKARDFTGSSDPQDSTYICKNSYLSRGPNSKNINSACYSEPDDCTLHLKNFGSTKKIDCPCLETQPSAQN